MGSYDPKLMSIERDVCDPEDIQRIINKKTGKNYVIGTIRHWLRTGLFKTLVKKGNVQLVARWEVDAFVPPPQGKASWKSKG